MKKFTIQLIVFLFFFVLTSEGQMKETAKGNNTFAIDLYKKIFSEDQNVFFSPYSISSALAMTYAGARGETEKQMIKVLHYDIKQENTHQGFFEINSSLNKYQKEQLIKLSIANALWEGLPLKQDYLDLTKKYYNASIFPLNGAKSINDWADLNTNGKIKEIVKASDLANAVLVLTNAIYFKGDWLTKFDEKITRKSIFKLVNDSVTNVDMMYMNSKVNYFEDAEKQIIELPYKNEKMTMIIVLPGEGSSLKSLTANMDEKQFTNFISKFTSREVNIYLPKFKFSSQFDLEKVLPKMGMPDAFNAMKADFSGMSQEGLSISKVKHKAIVEVNEKGSEAAAVTAVIMIKAAKMKEIFFKADRPFMFYIYDKTTNSILFMGSVLNPVKE